MVFIPLILYKLNKNLEEQLPIILKIFIIPDPNFLRKPLNFLSVKTFLFLSILETMCSSFFLKEVVLLLALLIQKNGAISNSNVSDHVALMEIKSKITDDPQGIFKSWNDSLHFCQWQGVTCGGRHQRVTFLNLTVTDLVGSLSPYLGNLSFLKVMSFTAIHFMEAFLLK